MKLSLQTGIEKLLQYRLTWHIGFWVGYIFFDSLGASVNIFKATFLQYYVFRVLSFMLYAYLLTLVVYPAFIKRSKYFSYIIIGLVLAVLVSKFQVFIYTYFKLENYQMLKLIQMLPFMVFFFALITFLKLGKDYYFNQQLLAKEKQRRIELELEFLKSQISPHFLFNTMNNLYGLSVTKSDLLPPLMLKLSDLLRYSLYETNQTFVPLSEEINYIKNYIELEKIRIGERLEVSTKFDEASISNIKIAPIVLIVFVENAFKHSRTVLNEKIKIDFDLHMENDWIVFTSVNNFYQQEKDRHSGIGLENVKKRLDLLYPEKFVLDIFTRDNVFFVHLTIDLF